MSERRWSWLWFAWFQLIRVSCLALPIVLAVVFARNAPWIIAVLWGGLIAFGLAGLGGWLVSQSAVGEIGYKNHLAAWCLPWGRLLGPGSLTWITLGSASIWFLIYLAVLLLELTGGLQTSSHLWLLLTWLILGYGWLRIVRMLMQNFQWRSRSSATQLKIACVLLALLASSIVLQAYGLTAWSLAVAGVPILVVGLPYGIFVLSMLTFGRNARWN